MSLSKEVTDIISERPITQGADYIQLLGSNTNYKSDHTCSVWQGCDVLSPSKLLQEI